MRLTRKFWHALGSQFEEIMLKFYTRLQANPDIARYPSSQRMMRGSEKESSKVAKLA